MEQLLRTKTLKLNTQLKFLEEEKKLQEDIKTFSYNIIKKRGLIANIKHFVLYDVIDKMLSYDYKYEHSYFQEAEAFKTTKGYIKYISKTVDTKFDFVSNDIEANYFNGFKTFITFNTKVYKFIKSYEKMRPLKKINLYTKRIEGLYPKQKEFYNLTGGNKNYHTMEVLTDVTDKTSTFSNIFAYFTFLKKHIISLLTQINHLSFNTLFQTIFIAKLAYFKHKMIVFLNGFKATLRKYNFKFKLDKKLRANKPPRSFFKMLNTKHKHSKNKIKSRRFFFFKKIKLKFNRFLLRKTKIRSSKYLNKKQKVNMYLLTKIKPRTHKLFLKLLQIKTTKKCLKQSQIQDLKSNKKLYKNTYAITRRDSFNKNKKSIPKRIRKSGRLYHLLIKKNLANVPEYL